MRLPLKIEGCDHFFCCSGNQLCLSHLQWSLNANSVSSAMQVIAMNRRTFIFKGMNLSDGRTISVPLAWYPRLLYGTPNERDNWQFIASNKGIHWPDLDEDRSRLKLKYAVVFSAL